MPTLTEPPPTRDEPRAAPRDFDLEALIKEARRRQRRRQAFLVAVVVAVGALIWIVVHGVTGGSAASVTHAGDASGAGRATVTSPFAAAFVVDDGRTHMPVPGGGLVIVRPGAHSCTRVRLPMFGGAISFSGSRYVYPEVDRRDLSRIPPVLRVGVVGRGEPRRARVRLRPFILPGYTRSSSGWTVTPVWIDRHVGLLESNVPRRAPRLHVAGRTIVLYVPRGADFGSVSASGNRLLYRVSWQNPWGTSVARTATFVYARGVSRVVRRSPGANSGDDTWSPDGSRIAFVERGDLWTMRADGSGARRLTHTRQVEPYGPLLWSADGKTIAYTTWDHRATDVYVVRAAGGAPRQLTHARAPSPPNAAAGYQALAWLGGTALAFSYSSGVEPDTSLGVIDTRSAASSTVCSLPRAAITTGTALR